jgi:hypothetical protein
MSRVFSAEHHARFAAVSGDFNPMHMDPVAARRTLAGAPVVHGVHTLLWLLDVIAGQQADLPPATSLKARFRRMVYVGDAVEARIRLGPTLRAEALIDGVEAVSVSLGFGAARAAPAPMDYDAAMAVGAAAESLPTSPLELSLEQLPGRKGRVRFAGPAAELFPRAAAYLGAARVNALACTSALVGMVVPGLHSMFGGLDVRLTPAADSADMLDYAVLSVDERFRLVRVAVRGGQLEGTLDALCRAPPAQQASMAVVAASVHRGEFAGTSALIVGGSRGLGEVTAKLIAAGGGRVVLTYRRGQEDAAAVAAEITDAGGRAEILPYDALQPAAPQLERLSELPTQAYYFATPPIGRRKRGLCDQQRLEEFNRYYATGFLDLAQALLQRQPAGVNLFYPSTVYIDERPAELTEYAMAKAAGEVLCAEMGRVLPGVRVLVRRLPRLPTDQTGSILPLETADPVEIMLAVIRDLHGASANVRGEEIAS